MFQLLKRHYARYTPELVEDVCGVPRDLFLTVAEALCDASGPDRTAAFCYAVGWTQHTVGVQYIRTAAIVQLLLGNIGRPGGGILALRGHASIQGSTDIPTLYNILPGYLPMPGPDIDGLDDYLDRNAAKTGFWGRMDTYVVSLLKAWWGEAATADNDFCFDYLPRISGDHSTYPTTLAMIDGTVHGYFVMGENPAVGSANGKLQRRALAAAEWLVVRDFSEIETASFWYDSPEIETGGAAHRDDRHRSVLHARRRAHGEGRQLHEHAALAAVASQGDRAAGRRAFGAVVHVPPRVACVSGSPGRPIRATDRCSTSRGATRPQGRSTSRAPRPSCAR